MELRQLRYSCAVARTDSFTRAALEEGVAEPSLSQQILRLELTRGAKLFDEYGRKLLPQAQAILWEVKGGPRHARVCAARRRLEPLGGMHSHRHAVLPGGPWWSRLQAGKLHRPQAQPCVKLSELRAGEDFVA